MTLDFPNESRSYDAKDGFVRFWGYDKVMEVSFFMEVGALLKMSPQMPQEESCYLEVFDAARDRILEVARKVHGRSRKEIRTHYLLAADF